MKKTILLLVLGILAAAGLHAEVITENIRYSSSNGSDKNTVMHGYLAYDDKIKGKRPGILVVHEWWGHNEYARKRARMLAKLGYVALSVDMYGGGRLASHPGDAGKFSSAVKKNMAVAEARFKAAYDELQKHSKTNKNKIAAIGYCFGGGIVLEMARRGLDLDAVASFHGSLGTANRAKSGKVKAKVLVMNGADDPFVKAESIAAFKKEMQFAGVDYEFINYPGARHAFSNPDADKYGKQFGLPLQYNKSADEKSWQKMQSFFRKIFRE